MIPTTQPNERPFTDTTGDTIPWPCEFCETRRGIKITQSVQKSVQKHKDAERELKQRKDKRSRVGWSLRTTYHNFRLRSKETKLDKQADKWFLGRWVTFDKLCQRLEKREEEEKERERERRAFLEGNLRPWEETEAYRALIDGQTAPSDHHNGVDGGEKAQISHRRQLQPQPQTQLQPLLQPQLQPQQDEVTNNQYHEANVQLGDSGHSGATTQLGDLGYTGGSVGGGGFGGGE
ncbi:hypothetical protein QQX98_002249 [Neonectria punicea]|uniref:Uncharacterized protein n=1 Tax=Neonectria punicea TaxID=979145 RepID=A0ABR1HKD4_9HYPO